MPLLPRVTIKDVLCIEALIKHLKVTLCLMHPYRKVLQGDNRYTHGFLVGNIKVRGHLGRLGVNEKIILKLILNIYSDLTSTGYICIRTGTYRWWACVMTVMQFWIL